MTLGNNNTLFSFDSAITFMLRLRRVNNWIGTTERAKKQHREVITP